MVTWYLSGSGSPLPQENEVVYFVTYLMHKSNAELTSAYEGSIQEALSQIVKRQGRI